VADADKGTTKFEISIYTAPPISLSRYRRRSISVRIVMSVIGNSFSVFSLRKKKFFLLHDKHNEAIQGIGWTEHRFSCMP
jgi:hypothetical protein